MDSVDLKSKHAGHSSETGSSWDTNIELTHSAAFRTAVVYQVLCEMPCQC